jgi:hypothetical protein
MIRPLLAILAISCLATTLGAADSYIKRFAVSEDSGDNGHYGESKDTAPIGGEPSLTDYGFRSDAFDAPDGLYTPAPESPGLPDSSQCIDIYNDNSDATDGYYDWFVIVSGCG